MFEALLKYPSQVWAEGRLVLLSPVPLEVLVLGLAGLVVVAWYLYRRVSVDGGSSRRRLLLGLRVAAMVILVGLLAVPAIRVSRPPRAAFTAVLVDVSRSMSIADASGGRSRLDAAKTILVDSKAAGLVSRLGEVTKVVLYGFDREARRTSSPDGLKPDGASTNLFRAVRDVEAELRGVPLAAVVLLTDGCRNEGGSAEDAARLLRARRTPLHIVGLGNPNPPKDFEVAGVFAPRRVRRNTEVEVYATIRHTDFRDPFDVVITRGDVRLASRRVEPVSADDDIERVRIAFTPDLEGTATYRVSVAPAPGEAVVDNNFREFVLETQDDRLPVLYVEGSPRLEYRFLRRALYRDNDFRLVGMLRLARDRFYIQSANESERYLERGFPGAGDGQGRERLFAFEAVILGDIEASFFTPEQLALLEEFVRVRGGGLLMLGGVNSFGLGKYAGTPVGRMLPFDVSPADPPYSDERFSCRLTDEGSAHAIMRLVPDAEDNRLLWEKAPPLIGLTPLQKVKAGAAVLLAHQASGMPVLAVQNYGQGRVAGFASGGSWYWQVSMPASDEFHEKFWKQLVRWLVVGARQRLAVETDADVVPRGRPVILKATVREKDLRPVSDASVVARVTSPLGNTEEIPMEWILSEDGVYQCRYVPADEGNYSVAVSVQGWDLPAAETGFEVSEPLVEFSNAGQKIDVLKRMAEMTGGRYYDESQATEIPEQVALAAKVAGQQGIAPIDRQVWDMPWLFAAMVALLGLEWFIRRRSGLA